MDNASSTSHLPYRPCVGVMLINADGKIWVGERIDTPGAWQMPQGGIDPDETPLSAATRELEEETGIAAEHVTLVDQTKDWLTYDLPQELVLSGKVWKGKFRGQKQRWFLYRLDAADSLITIDQPHPEFSAWRWTSPQRLIKDIVPFKREIYLSVCKQFGNYLPS
ncbi:RNA pyrophosphohydrolase [Temperatibacter marinus]|uniref:RNA pyrophosphohydrolase n=1 Tax=Temperatibacter marinus TaxID=1456591 RepID=A0AA52ED03_9PROT|nr:RNA pyrophosphohydrolase [Temperatibacter marinus]WND01438.1 RNA pyrophosphohydrolase [Temperatibacter marinus]